MNKIKIDYYEPMNTVFGQLEVSSAKRHITILHFMARRIRNHICEMIAYRSPIRQLRIMLHRLRGVKIGERVQIGMEVIIDHAYPEFVTIEDDCTITGYNYILVHSHPNEHFSKILDSYVAPVRIKKGAWIAVGAIILPGVTVGEYSIVSAGSVVTKDVPPYSIVAGNPAELTAHINKNWIKQK